MLVKYIFAIRIDCMNTSARSTFSFYLVTAVGKYGSKRHGVRVEKGKIVVE